MKYVVAYDIEDDRARNKVAKLLEGYGTRVQESVFECGLDERGMEELTGRLEKILPEAGGGNIRFYRVCAGCFGASFSLGDVSRRSSPDGSRTCIIV